MATMPAYSPDAAARYDRTAEPVMGPFAAVLIDAAQIHPEAVVLDLACGPGFAARIAAERAGPMGTVVGVDPDRSMVQVAATHGAGYAIEWRQADPGDLPLVTDSVDRVLSLHGIGALGDPHTALAEGRRVVRETGSFAATVWSPTGANPYFAAQERALTELGPPGALEVLHGGTRYDGDALVRDLRAAGWHDPISREVTVRIRLAGTTAAAAERLRGLPWGVQLEAEQAVPVARSMLRTLAEFAEADGSLVVPFRSQLVHAYP